MNAGPLRFRKSNHRREFWSKSRKIQILGEKIRNSVFRPPNPFLPIKTDRRRDFQPNPRTLNTRGPGKESGFGVFWVNPRGCVGNAQKWPLGHPRRPKNGSGTIFEQGWKMSLGVPGTFLGWFLVNFTKGQNRIKIENLRFHFFLSY